jgi:hypothetical protein
LQQYSEAQGGQPVHLTTSFGTRRLLVSATDRRNSSEIDLQLRAYVDDQHYARRLRKRQYIFARVQSWFGVSMLEAAQRPEFGA